MIDPPVEEIIKKVDNRYTLVVETAKRARQLVDGAKKLTDYDSNKPVTVAIHEINEGKVTYERVKEGIK